MYWNTGVSYQEAVANNWILRDAAGNYIHNAGYRDNFIGDIGNTAYQQRWASNVASYLPLSARTASTSTKSSAMPRF